MIISEKKLRKIVKDLVLEFEIGRISSRSDSKLVDVGDSDDFVSGDYKYEFQGSGKYVMPAPIFNGTDYSEKLSSPPQEKRRDVGSVHNKETGEERERGDHPHRGYDFATPVGTPIVTFIDGVVSKVNTDASNSGGKYVYIDHNDASVKSTGYLHLSSILVKNGDKVKTGQVIGLSGETGNITGPHLHFSIKKTGESKSSYDKDFYDSLFKDAKKVKITKKSENKKNSDGNGNSPTTSSNTPKTNNKGSNSNPKLPSAKPGTEMTKTISGKSVTMKKWQGFPYAVEIINPDSRQFKFYSRKGKEWSRIEDKEIIAGLSKLL